MTTPPISRRQLPVVTKLDHLLEQAEAIAAAVADNSLDDLQFLPVDVTAALLARISKIQKEITNASASPAVVRA